MIKAIFSATILCLLTVPVLGIADQSDRQGKRVDQHWHSARQGLVADSHSLRRSGTQARLKVYQTNRHAVQRRVVKQRLYLDSEYRQRASRRWQANHLNTDTRLAFYNDYYGYNNGEHFGQHRRHYESFHGHHSAHKKHHQDDSDYLEWVAVMSLLSEIYDDEYDDQ
jgi:hypothetical protein